MSKIIVTGGAGFIGSNLVDKLVDLNHQVIVIDDFSTGKKENLKKSKNKISIINECLNLKSSIIKKIPINLKGSDFIFHLAALPRIERSLKDPLGTHKANVEGTLAALELARKLKVKRFIYTSSSSIYGIQKKLPLKENLHPNPQNPYAYQKLMGEYYCKIYSDIYKLPVIVFRLFNVYGSRMMSKGSYKLVFTKWLEQIRKNHPLSIYGSGDQTRDFTYITDVTGGLTKAIDSNIKNKFLVLNLGAGRQVTIKQLAKLFLHPAEFFPERLYEERFKEADIKKAKKLIGFSPAVSIEEGVNKLLKYYLT